MFDVSAVLPNIWMLDTDKRRSPVTIEGIMDFITIFFVALVLGTIVLAPRFGAESRPGFLGGIGIHVPAGRLRDRGADRLQYGSNLCPRLPSRPFSSIQLTRPPAHCGGVATR